MVFLIIPAIVLRDAARVNGAYCAAPTRAWCRFGGMPVAWMRSLQRPLDRRAQHYCDRRSTAGRVVLGLAGLIVPSEETPGAALCRRSTKRADRPQPLDPDTPGRGRAAEAGRRGVAAAQSPAAAASADAARGGRFPGCEPGRDACTGVRPAAPRSRMATTPPKTGAPLGQQGGCGDRGAGRRTYPGGRRRHQRARREYTRCAARRWRSAAGGPPRDLVAAGPAPTPKAAAIASPRIASPGATVGRRT
jgi:hypothetical protein